MTGRSSCTVLVVEDDHEIREALGEVLEEEGYCVVTAMNGRDALDVLHRGRREGARDPDLILLDLMMPVLDGAGFRYALLEDDAFAKIPVVVLTAQPTALSTLPSISLALRKPVRLKELVDAVEEICA